MMSNAQIKKWLYLFWIYTLLVILWGAWVRISHSGNGCGDHWPLCNGDLIPSLENKKTLIEFLHRIMSGLYGFLVIYIYFKFKRDQHSTVRKLSLALLVFMVIEALLGALLVKQNLVTVNDSVLRMIVMSFHQLNSFLLTGTTYLLALVFGENKKIKVTSFHIILLALAMTGAIASLAATLFPTVSIWEGILKDFSSDSHLFIKLRGLHPLLALLSISYVIYKLYTNTTTDEAGQKINQYLVYKLFAGLMIGIITLLTLSPIWLKIFHLLFAHYLWAEILKYQLLRQHQPM